LNALTYKQRALLLDKEGSKLSLRHQCNILDINRSSLYYEPVKPSIYDIALEKAVRYQYLKTPFYGHIKTTKALQQMGFKVGWKKVRSLRKQFGIEAIYPKPNLSKPRKENIRYPYLLKGLEICRVNQVWSTDITYIKIKGKGWIYLVAVIDWYSRHILSFETSITLENIFCINSLENALAIATPEIFNVDQGSQFTSEEFLNVLKNIRVRISMDSKGRALDNIRCERFWRSVKYEEVYLKEYNTVEEARQAIQEYILFYNHERIHQSLNYFTPYEIYYGLKTLN
jgi:putative transposase